MFNPRDCQIGDFVGYVDLEVLRPKPIATDGRPLYWHILITEVSSEKTTRERIREIGPNPYLPVLHKEVSGGRGRKRRTLEEPMFFNRLFVPMPLDEESWHRVRGVRGVKDFMTTEGRRPALLPELAIEEIRKTERAEDAKYLRELAKREESPYRKDRAVWAELMLRKMLGKIHGRDARGRIEVLLEVEIFGRRIWAFEPHQLQFVEP